ncbi:hypothetical protein Mro03_63920 [Microbispora rosea subsp. rosea]|nr:hypothetical protein Mro03_63920 [Microbispora rosea subsp. rosea]
MSRETIVPAAMIALARSILLMVVLRFAAAGLGVAAFLQWSRA